MSSEDALFMGKRVGDMTREELIEVIEILARMVEAARNRHLSDMRNLVG